MPRIVDHDAKRSQVVSLTTKVIARDGIHSVSLREIAVAADASTAIISHYFSGKVELLLHTYRENLRASQARQASVVPEDREGLIALASQILPLDEARKDTWRISIAFMAMALNDPEFGREWENNLLACRERIKQSLERMVENGAAPKVLDVETAARSILALIRGISTEVMISSEDWPPERQVAMFEAGLDVWLVAVSKRKSAKSKRQPAASKRKPAVSKRKR